MKHPKRKRAATVAVAALALGAAALPALASSPSSSTLAVPSQKGQTATDTWTGTLPPGANSDSDCSLSTTDALNDHHHVTITVPTGFYDKHKVVATFSTTLGTPAAADTILTVAGPGGVGGSADNGSVGSGEVVAITNPPAGDYDVIACDFAGGPQPYTGTLTLETQNARGNTRPGGTSPRVTPPTYDELDSPDGEATDSGEPSIGSNWKSGNILYQSGLTTYKVDPADGSWTDVSALNTSITSLDPILATDSPTGRTFVSQLSGFDSLAAYSDDDYATSTPSQGGGIPSGVDHQTIGGGPYPSPLPTGVLGPVTSYPHAVYYCSQELVTAFCARSDDGGLTFGPGIPIYTSECGGLHGHVRISPDGTVYVPNKACGSKQGMAVSRDAGTTWQVLNVPFTTPGDSDPSIGLARDNTAYFGTSNGDGHPVISVSRDHGTHWSKPVDVGASLGIVNSAFPEVIAGDGDRAAFAFLGTTTPGDSQDPDFGKDPTGTYYTGGEYHLYVSTTYDRGRTWSTVDATPKSIVQRGKICQGGTVGCGPSDRNLLDFMDITVDRTGHVLVGWADGCTGACETSNAVADNSFSAKGAVTRQISGKPLFRTKQATVS